MPIPPKGDALLDPLRDGVRLERLRLLNPRLAAYCDHHNRDLPKEARIQILAHLGGADAPLEAGHFNTISDRYATNREVILKSCPNLPAAALMSPPDPRHEFPHAGQDFRATQFMAALAPRIDRMARISATLPDHVHPVLQNLRRTGMAPKRRRLPTVSQAKTNSHTGPSTGTTLVACMKNEAPFIIEWIAHHRAIGVDKFLIYTNDCTDGTADILDRLSHMGLVEHRDNTDWKGKSPQQHALNQSLREDAIKKARWVVHIDVDEFINVRCGDGTLSALFEAAPKATHFAMTWRLFGHGGVHRYIDALVTEQFTRCAPVYCPKPHSAWGFKTLGQNIGAYEKIGCHRPNKLRTDRAESVTWVNGSGDDITSDLAERGWRSNRTSIGYDLVQLNHYALRSAESFLVKRDRGRALHVDRAIGRNYWIRMDWGGDVDFSFQRQIPRLRAERDRLLADPVLATQHQEAVAWHKSRITDLRAQPEFAALYDEITTLSLADDERAAWSIALSMDS
ncbi:MAG: glycosyltransferase family 2 protein [Primorskyibacter sp.]